MLLKLHKLSCGKGLITPIILLGACLITLSAEERSLEETIEKGVSFLTEKQNADGSWGGVRKTKGLNIFAPIPGAHDAFKMGASSLALSGLIAHEKEHSSASPTIEKAEKWLLGSHREVKRATGDALYNVWAHAYGLRAFADLAQRAEEDAAYTTAAQHEYNQLLKFEVLGGGWSYYNFGTNYGGIYTRTPSGDNFSFVTATVLSALDYCRKELPLDVNEKRLTRTYKSLLRQRLPDGSYLYGEYLKNRPRYVANRPVGSLARTPAALNALMTYEENEVPQSEIDEWVNRFIDRHGFLENAKKRPIPHESPFAISGYYYYYGHYYVSELSQHLSPEAQKECVPALVKILIEAQEKNGSWWDYPLYDYHEPYGTGYALKALANYQKLLNPAE